MEQDVKQPEEQDIQPQEKEDVNQESSEDIQQNQQETEVESQPVQETSEETPSEVGQPSVDEEVDDMGVPYKNRYMEMKRKYGGVTEQLSEMKEMIGNIQQGSQKQKYTPAQLRAFANDPETSAQERMWAEQELDKLQKEELGKVVEQKLTSYQQKQQADQMKSQALRTVQQRHPDAFVRNAQGQIVGWNEKSPLTRKIGQYLRDPEIQNNPRGLLVATALANWELSGKTTAQSNKLRQEVKNLQKKTLVEGGGKPQPVEKSAVRKALDKAKQGDGRKTDSAQAAMKEMLRARGMIE